MNNRQFLNIIILFTLLLLNKISYTQNSSLIGKLVDENNDIILFAPINYEYLEISGKVKSNENGYFIIKNLKKGEKIRLKITPLGLSTIDTIITISSDTIKFIFKLPCILDGQQINKELAKKDISNNKIRIIINGGIAPTFYKNDYNFEKKYHVKFWTSGCQPPISNKCKSEYNKIVFNYLDKNYGENWRKEIRKDVLQDE